MKKMILTAVMLAAAALCRAQQPAETGERREWLTSFTAVEVSAPLDIRFVPVPDTEAPKIVYDTKGSYTTRFRAEVRDKVLRISERADARRPDRTSVTVYYNSLERIAIADAVATFDSTLVATVLDLTVGGMAQVTARMDVKDLKMELSGKSSATLTGDVRYLSLFVSTGRVGAGGDVRRSQRHQFGHRVAVGDRPFPGQDLDRGQDLLQGRSAGRAQRLEIHGRRHNTGRVIQNS